MKNIITLEDLENNPDLVNQGLNVGDEIDLPESNNANEEDESDPLPPKTPPVTPPLA